MSEKDIILLGRSRRTHYYHAAVFPAPFHNYQTKLETKKLRSDWHNKQRDFIAIVFFPPRSLFESVIVLSSPSPAL
jgi:hypothetical protein